MSVRSGQSITIVFPISSFATGAAVNADSLPVGTLYVNGVANGATVVVANLSTGLYTVQVTLPTLAIGDLVSLEISATVAAIAAKGVVWRDMKDVLLDANGDVTPAAGSIPTAAEIAAAVLTDTIDGQSAGMWPYIIIHQLGGAFTTNSSSVFTAASLVNAQGGTGPSGPNIVPILVTDSLGNPLQLAQVQMVLNNSDDQRLPTGNMSPNLGKVTFSTATATYTVSIYLSGYTFAPIALAVTGNMTLQTYVMTALSITPSPPPYITAYGYCYDAASGLGVAGIKVTRTMTLVPSNQFGITLDTKSVVVETDSTGLYQFLNTVPGATYQFSAAIAGKSPIATVTVLIPPGQSSNYAIQTFKYSTE